MALSALGLTPADQIATPHRFFWPGLGFLVASGVVSRAWP